MFLFLPSFLRGAVVFIFYVIFTVVLCLIFFVVAAVKLIPVPSVRIGTTKVLNGLSNAWVVCSIYTHKIVGSGVNWRVRGADGLSVSKWCLLTSNHQSWADILILVQSLYGRVPPFKFFVKKELLWIPLMGFAFWGLDFPIMKRYSKQFLEKNPHLKGKDLETTRRSCEKFKEMPVSIINFVEGTRFTRQKYIKQQSPFSHLLKPKAGGTAMVMYAMGDYLEDLIDVTIVYPDGVPALWDFFCGRRLTIEVDVRKRKIPEKLRSGNYFDDPVFRERFQSWLNDLWTDKDRRIHRITQRAAVNPIKVSSRCFLSE